MSTLYVDRAGYCLEQDGHSILVRDGDGTLRQRLPFGPLERVVLQGDLSLHTGLLLALAKHGVEVICLGGRDGQHVVHCLGPKSKDGERRLAQYRVLQHPVRHLELARLVLRAKLRAQGWALRSWYRAKHGDHRLLREALTAWPTLREHALGATMEEVLGIEGRAAALYFTAFFSTLPKAFQAQVRVRRPPTDPANAILSLAYTLLHHEAIHAIHGVGLDPYLGALHSPSHGRESLTCDLIEPLRSPVDEWIRHILHQQVLRPEHFYSDRGAVFLGKVGRSNFYRAWMRYVPRLRRRLRAFSRMAWHLLERS
ncbi:CRISPR-associated endonuclease Cas1 [Acidithiobacillus caldus]